MNNQNNSKPILGSCHNPCDNIRIAFDLIQFKYGDEFTHVSRQFKPDAHSSIPIGIWVKNADTIERHLLYLNR